MAAKKTATPKKKPTRRPSQKGSGAPYTARPRGVAVEPTVLAGDVAAVVEDGFFGELVNDLPYVKAGINGGVGAGGLELAADLAIAVHIASRSRRPVVVVDTARSTRHLVGRFKRAGVPAVVKHTRSLVDWRDAVDRAGEGAVILTTSLTHIWEDFLRSYMQARTLVELGPSNWVEMKAVWHQQWAEVFTDSPQHHLFTARSAADYLDIVDADTGKVTQTRAGTKIRGETETAYEPALLIDLQVADDGAVVGRVVEDATGTIPRGRAIPAPRAEDFAAVVAATLAGAVEYRRQEQSSTAALFALSGRPTREHKALIDELRTTLDRRFPGLSVSSKQQRAQALYAAAGTSSWQRLEAMPVDQLDRVREQLHRVLAGPTVITAQAAGALRPEHVLEQVRQGLAAADGDVAGRATAIATARQLAGHVAALDTGVAASIHGLIDRHQQRWEDELHNQADPYDGDDLPC